MYLYITLWLVLSFIQFWILYNTAKNWCNNDLKYLTWEETDTSLVIFTVGIIGSAIPIFGLILPLVYRRKNYTIKRIKPK